MKDLTRTLINGYLLKQRVDEGFTDRLEGYLKSFATRAGALSAILEKIKEQIGINNAAFVNSHNVHERQRLSFAMSVLIELVRRLEGFPPDRYVLAA